MVVQWPAFDNNMGIDADITLACPVEYGSMNILIPIGGKRFYYNRKINCLPETDWVEYGNLRSVPFNYTAGDYMIPWEFTDRGGKLKLLFTPIKDRSARTNLGSITSELHQIFGKFNGEVIVDDQEIIPINDIIGFAEEHHAKW